MNTNLIFILVISLTLVACGGAQEEGNRAKDKKKSKSGETASENSNPLLAPVDYVGAVGRAKNVSEKRINLVNIQNAIKQFQIVEGRYPKSLDELVSEGYYAKLPDPPKGKRYLYNSKTGQIGIK
tara:strand:+ start:1032 stop:1406 length:375 start_codon:yes stop_codon:yes gene_type:complete